MRDIVASEDPGERAHDPDLIGVPDDSAAADLEVRPPGACVRGAGRARAADVRRAHHRGRRSRAFLTSPVTMGAAGRPREGQDQGREGPVRGAGGDEFAEHTDAVTAVAPPESTHHPSHHERDGDTRGPPGDAPPGALELAIGHDR